MLPFLPGLRNAFETKDAGHRLPGRDKRSAMNGIWEYPAQTHRHIVIAFPAALCGYEDYGGMEEFGRLKLDFFKSFLELPHGIPDKPAFRRVLQCLNPRELREGLEGRFTDMKLRKNGEGTDARGR
jgi:hypothetical protein